MFYTSCVCGGEVRAAACADGNAWRVPSVGSCFVPSEEQGSCSPAASTGSAGAQRLAAALRKEPPLWATGS